MIGLAVVVFVTVFAAGISASVGNAIDRNFQGDLVLQNTDGFSPISPGAGARGGQGAGRADGLLAVLRRRAWSGGKDVRVSAVDPKNVSDVLSLDWEEGSPETLSSLDDNQTVLDDAWAKSNDIEVGDRIVVRTPLERDAHLHRDGHGQGQRRPARQPGGDPERAAERASACARPRSPS